MLSQPLNRNPSRVFYQSTAQRARVCALRAQFNHGRLTSPRTDQKEQYLHKREMAKPQGQIEGTCLHIRSIDRAFNEWSMLVEREQSSANKIKTCDQGRSSGVAFPYCPESLDAREAICEWCYQVIDRWWVNKCILVASCLCDLSL